MKKLASVILAAILALSLLPALAEQADFLGVWYLQSYSINGQHMEAADLGMSMVLELAADGAGAARPLNGPDESLEMNWREENGQVLVNQQGVDMVLTVEGEELRLEAEQEGAVMILIFTRTAPELLTAPEGEEVAIESVEQLNGTWTLLGLQSGGTYVDGEALEQMGLTYGLVFADGSCTVYVMDQEVSTLPVELRDGKAVTETMTLTMIEGEILVQTDEYESVIYYTRVRPE